MSARDLQAYQQQHLYDGTPVGASGVQGPGLAVPTPAAATPNYYGDPLRDGKSPWQPYIYGGGYGGLRGELNRSEGNTRALEARAFSRADQSGDVAAGYRQQGAESYQDQQGSRAETMSALDRLRGFYQQGPGPSAAEAQLRMGAGQSMANALSLARSGRGAGGGAVAMRNAGFQNAATMQQTNAQAGALRAQEGQAWRQQQMGAMGLEQNALANLRGADINAMGQANQTGLGYGNLGLGYNAQGINASQFGDNLRHQILGGQLSSEMQGYGAEMGYKSAHDGQSPWWVKPAITAVGAGIGFLAGGPPGAVIGGGVANQAASSSDIRAKKNIEPAEASPSLRNVFGAPPTAALDDAYSRQMRETGPRTDLRPARAYSYEYKNPAAVGAGPGRYVGPMAQDLERTPAGASAVVDTPNGKAVDTGRLTLVNSSAISETQRRQDELAQQMESLQRLLDTGHTRQTADVGARFGGRY